MLQHLVLGSYHHTMRPHSYVYLVLFISELSFFRLISFLCKALLMENVQGRCNVTSKQATLCMTTPHVPGNYHLILKLHLYVYLVQINLLIISFNLFPFQILGYCCTVLQTKNALVTGNVR